MVTTKLPIYNAIHIGDNGDNSLVPGPTLYDTVFFLIFFPAISKLPFFKGNFYQK